MVDNFIPRQVTVPSFALKNELYEKGNNVQYRIALEFALENKEFLLQALGALNFKITDNKGIIDFITTNLDYMVNLIISLQDKVKVVSPPILQERVLQTINKMKKIMRGDILMAPSLGYDIAKGGRSLMKMPMKIETEMFAPCGMNCMVCYKHCHTKKTKQPCGGCMVESKGKPEHCRKCKIKDCVQSKGIKYCYDCSDFPCKLIKNLERSYNKRYSESLIENSRIVMQKGIPHLMEAHIQKYACPECGGIISLHDKVCTECGKERK